MEEDHPIVRRPNSVIYEVIGKGNLQQYVIQAPDGTLNIRTEITAPTKRRGFEDRLKRRVTLRPEGFQASHSVGAGFGREIKQGIYWAPKEVNLIYMNTGIEDRIRELHKLKKDQYKLFVKIEARVVPATRVLKEVNYVLEFIDTTKDKAIPVGIYEASIEIVYDETLLKQGKGNQSVKKIIPRAKELGAWQNIDQFLKPHTPAPSTLKAERTKPSGSATDSGKSSPMADPRATVEKGKENRSSSESRKLNPLTTSSNQPEYRALETGTAANDNNIPKVKPSNQPEYRALETGTAANDNDTPKIKIDDPKPKGVGKLAKVGKVAGWTLRLGASLFVGAIVEETLSYVFRKIFNIKTFEEELQSKLNEINKNISTKIELEIEKNEEFIKNAYRTASGIPIYLNIVWLYEFTDLLDHKSLQKVEIYLINISHVKLDNLGLNVNHSKEIRLGKSKSIKINYYSINKIKTITQSSLLVLPSDIFGTWIIGRSLISVQQSPIGVLWIRLADNNNIEISGAGIAIRRGALGVNEYRQYNQSTKEYGIEGVLKFERWSIESRIIEPSLPNKPKKLVLEIKSQKSNQKLRLSVEIYNTDNKLSFTGNLSNQKVSGTMHRATSPFYEIQEYPENNQKNKLIISSVFDHFVGLQKIRKENPSTMVSPWDFDKFDIYEELPPKHLGVQLPDIHSGGFYLSQYGEVLPIHWTKKRVQ